MEVDRIAIEIPVLRCNTDPSLNHQWWSSRENGPIAPFSQMRRLGGQSEWRSGSASLRHKEMSEAGRIAESERHGALCTSIDSF